MEQSPDAQLKELEVRLARSMADWKIVVGHHPIRSDLHVSPCLALKRTIALLGLVTHVCKLHGSSSASCLGLRQALIGLVPCRNIRKWGLL